MLQVGGGPDLPQEPLGADHGRELGLEQLERDPSPMAEIVRQVHRRHAAGAQLSLQAIAVRQRGLEALEELGHRIVG